MRAELERKLQREFPALLADLHGSPYESGLADGLSIEDGWYALLRDLCRTLEKRRVAHALTDLRFTQIKEKFGELRAYVTGGDPAVHAARYAAQEASATVCERCGATRGARTKPLTSGWLKTYCAPCRKSANAAHRRRGVGLDSPPAARVAVTEPPRPPRTQLKA